MTKKATDKIHNWHTSAVPPTTMLPTVGQYYDLYRLGLVMASVGREDDTGIQTRGAWEDKPVVIAYTDADAEIINKTIKKMGLPSIKITTSKSKEPDDTHKISPLPLFKETPRKS